MRIYFHIKDERLELEDNYALNEPLQNQSFFLQVDGEKKKYTIVRVDNILIKSGKSVDVQKDIYLEE